jgi:membrane-associated protease RseP (regulator of RpoE activity)
MAILVCHEFGHYFFARRHRIDVSLPYFIPLPMALGTLGAVIRMRSPISDRNHLLDVGAAGPIAGMVIAIPCMIVGLEMSTLAPIVADADVVLEGNSLAYLGLKYLVTGHWLPTSDGLDVQLHPVAFAAWVGFLITMINLIPVGQLDGGHIACAFLGDRYQRFAGRLHWALGLVGAGVCGAMALAAWRAGQGAEDAVVYGLGAGLPWLVWGGWLLIMKAMTGGEYHPPVSDEPLTRGRRTLVVVMAVLFIAIFTPVPLRQPLL